jgi:hypothetical protein
VLGCYFGLVCGCLDKEQLALACWPFDQPELDETQNRGASLPFLWSSAACSRRAAGEVATASRALEGDGEN